jgi:hypothetical protein
LLHCGWVRNSEIGSNLLLNMPKQGLAGFPIFVFTRLTAGKRTCQRS